VLAEEVNGFLGPNGTGKTTRIPVLLGLNRAAASRAELFGVDACREPVAAHRRIASTAETSGRGPERHALLSDNNDHDPKGITTCKSNSRSTILSR